MASNMKQSHYSIVALKRWSCKSKEIPGVPQIKSLHVYDFDNTLFQSPLPNPSLWNGESIGRLQSDSTFIPGGWWHNPAILGATGEGIEIEEPRGWAGWWNETIVKLVEISTQQKDALTVLLTGRGETSFADLINRISNSRNLDFDLIALKPEAGPQNQRFSSTMDFKQAFLRDLIFTYKNADEIRLYEDRPKHVKGFRSYFEQLNKSLLSHRVDEPPPSRKPIVAEVIHVCEQNAPLDMQIEATEIASLLHRHNTALTELNRNSDSPSHRYRPWTIRENHIYCGYLIKAADSQRLISLTSIPAQLIDSTDVRLMASNILISPYPATPQILNRVGGKGNKVNWQVTHVAAHENRLWAAKVQAVDGSGEKFYTHDPMPMVVLACRRGTRPIDASRIPSQKWQEVSVDKSFVFETVVGDKVMLRIEEGEGEYLGLGSQTQGQNQRGNYGGGQKRKFRDRGSRSPPDFGGRGKENYPNERRASDMNGERDDGSWIQTAQFQGQNQGQSGRYHNQNQGQQNGSGQGRFSNQGSKSGQQQQQQQLRGGGGEGNSRGSRGGQNGSGGGRNFSQGNENQNQGQQRQNQHQRNRGGGGGGQSRGRGVGRAGGGQYKSLDDYGPAGNFDGASEFKAGGLEMNY